MTLSYRAKITVNGKDKTKAIFDSINTDNVFYPENPTRTNFKLDKNMEIEIESNHLPHLRANLNSTLRLIQACYETIESAKK